jgi:hypothetical protein
VISYWSLWIQNHWFLSTCGAYLEVVLEFEWKAAYSGSLRAKLISARLGMPEMSLTHNKLTQNVICSNLHTNSKHAPKTYQTWEVL